MQSSPAVLAGLFFARRFVPSQGAARYQETCMEWVKNNHRNNFG
jgi:hypothetical protein